MNKEVNDNIGIGIITSAILKHRYMACKNTWINDFSNVFLFGGDREDENLIKIKGSGDRYSSAFLKQQLGLKYMFEKNNNYDWYLICGCDTVLFRDRILKSLSVYDRNSDIILSEIYGRNCQINELGFKLFAGGAGFFISNSLMAKLYSIIDDFNAHWNDLYINGYFPIQVQYAHGDVAMCYMLKKYFNMEAVHLNGMFHQSPEYYLSPELSEYEMGSVKYINEPLSYHYIKPHEMKVVYDKFKTN